MYNSKTMRKTKILLFILCISIIATVGYFYQRELSPLNVLHLKKEQDASILFLSEVYDTIKNNYWETISDQDLVMLFKLALDRVTQKPQVLNKNTKQALLEVAKKTVKNMPSQKKKEVVTKTVAIVLASLKPYGRSVLYTTKQETQLKNLVQNINPEKDLYKDLGVQKNASEEVVKRAYDEKEAKLKENPSEEAQKELAQAQYAKEVLIHQDTKKNYDAAGIEPTVFTKLISPNVFYIQLKRFSPTTYDEFQKAANTYTDPSNGPQVLIFDLRGNIGGAIDETAHFLGNFLGINQYAYDFYQKRKYEPFKTPTDKLAGLARYKQVVILVDNHTKSSAELLSASLKRYHFGVVVGVPTSGWGTIEKVFPIDHQIDETEKYSLFLVHHITIRDDGQPIEGRGVEPNVNIKDPNWENQLYSYFHNPQLTLAVKQIWNTN